MASLKDVAALAGVSMSTVSRVVNGNIPVEAKTKQKVEEAIKKLGYRPNLMAKSLRSGNGKMIGLIVPRVLRPTYPFFMQYAFDRCQERGYTLIIGCHNDDPDLEESLVDAFSQYNLNGLLCVVADGSNVLGRLHKSTMTSVLLDYFPGNKKYNCITVDNYLAGKIMAEHFLSLGHTRIGCATGSFVEQCSRDRLQGFKETLAGHGVTLQDRFVVESAFDFDAGFNAAKKMLCDPNDLPTAVWGQSDDIAAGFLKYAYSIGISVPRGLSIAGMDDTTYSRIITPSLTTISQSIQKMMERAVDLVVDNENAGVRTILLEPELIIRESTSHVVDIP